MKKATLLCALTLLMAVAASGCDSSGIQTITNDTTDTGTAQAGSPVTADDEAIAPTDTQTTDDTATTTAPDNTNPGTGGGGGNGGGGGGGGPKPTVADRASLDRALLDEPVTPTPDTGGGSLDDRDGVGCHFQGPTGGKTRRKPATGQHNEADDILSENNCIML